MSDRPARRRSGALIALAVLLAFGLGLGASRLMAGSRGTGAAPGALPADGEAAPVDPGDEAARAVEVHAPTAEGRIDPSAATTPALAVEGFLLEESLGAFERSYGFLSEADREEFSSPAAWIAGHADLLPLTGYVITDVGEGDDEVAVEAVTTYRASLDPVIGLTPGRARSRWTAVAEDGEWRVHLAGSTLDAVYPAEEDVAGVVRAWAEARQACQTPAPGEYAGGLDGLPTLAAQLCDAEGELELSEPTLLSDGFDTTSLLAAYGPEVYGWARVVVIRSPVEMGVVAAPIGDQWQVMGIVRQA